MPEAIARMLRFWPIDSGKIAHLGAIAINTLSILTIVREVHFEDLLREAHFVETQ